MRVIVPNAPALRLPFGARKFVWLSRLNASSRNSNAAGPPSANLFDSASVELPELRTAHGVAPGVAERLARIGRRATQARLNQLVIVCALARRKRIAGHVGAVVVRAAEVLRDARHDERGARRVGQRHRLAGVDAVDAGQLPAADDRVQHGEASDAQR